jgi:NAD(P)-dependent dehydrogenase (short-subunit alcohol dehydrogenase family)
MTDLSGAAPFAGDAVVITGAAQGIGRAIAIELARSGAGLELWDISACCDDTAMECRNIGAVAFSRKVDVSDPEQVGEAAKAAIASHERIFGLINNAGIYVRASILESEPDLWRKTLATNLLGAVHCVQAIGPVMIHQRRGVIINVASGRGLQGTPRGAHYAASKAALLSFTKSLALEFAPHGIRANAVIPGLTETAQPLADATLEQLHARGDRIPLGRIGQPDDVAGVVGFLLSPAARYITGQGIAVNGGSIMIP